MSRPLLKSSQDAVARAAFPRLFVLELNTGRIHSMNTDGFFLPNKTVADLREDIDSDKLDLLHDFSVAAREDLLRLQY
jgi:hypothetical protein